MSTTRPSTPASSRRAPVQTTALVVGAAFLLVGVLGFVPGITTDYGSMSGAGHHSGAMLLGVFQVSVLHNLLHLAFGVVGILLSRKPSRPSCSSSSAGSPTWPCGSTASSSPRTVPRTSSR